MEKPGDVPDAVRETLVSPGPALLESVTDRDAVLVEPFAGDQLRGGS